MSIPPPIAGQAAIPLRHKVRFTDRDAADIVNLVNRAPLQNMKEAGLVAQLLMRFQQWFAQQDRAVTLEVQETAAPEVEKEAAAAAEGAMP